MEEIINFETLKQIIGEDKESIASFVEFFKEQSEIDIAEFTKFIKEKNYAEIAKCAHKLKSSYGSIGSTAVYNTLAELDKSAKENLEFDVINGLFGKFLELHSKILSEFDNFLNN